MDTHIKKNYPILDLQADYITGRELVQSCDKKSIEFSRNVAELLAAYGTPYESIGVRTAHASRIMQNKNDGGTALEAIDYIIPAFTIEKDFWSGTRVFNKIIQFYTDYTGNEEAIIDYIMRSGILESNPEVGHDAFSKVYGKFGNFVKFFQILENARGIGLAIEPLLSRFIERYIYWSRRIPTRKFDKLNIDKLVDTLCKLNPNDHSIRLYIEYMARKEGLRKKTKEIPVVSQTNRTIDIGTIEDELAAIGELSKKEEVFNRYQALCTKSFLSKYTIIWSSIERHPLMQENPKLQFLLFSQLSGLRDSRQRITWLEKLVKLDPDKSHSYYNLIIKLGVKSNYPRKKIKDYLKSLSYYKDSGLSDGDILESAMILLNAGYHDLFIRVVENLRNGPCKDTLILITKVRRESENKRKSKLIIDFINRMDAFYPARAVIEIVELCSEFLGKDNPIYNVILEKYPQLKDRIENCRRRENDDKFGESSIKLSSMNGLWNGAYKPMPINQDAARVITAGWIE